MNWEFFAADAARLPLADASVDLVMGSPPYLDARSYGIGAKRGCDDWIDWMMQVTREAVRVSRGLVLWVVAGVTRDWCYQPGPEGLLYRWWAEGGQCWRPAYWHRVGICGSGGRQGLRPDVESVLFFTSCKKSIPWADNTANGHVPKYAPGGAMSYRLSNGQRVNQWGMNVSADGNPTSTDRDGADEQLTKRKRRPSHRILKAGAKQMTQRRSKESNAAEDERKDEVYIPPDLANPGKLVQGIPVGGGHMGSKLGHESEAPYPVNLPKWFIRSFCPPAGLVLDPFIGSGTTAQAAVELGRNVLGCDLRPSQLAICERRMQSVQPDLL